MAAASISPNATSLLGSTARSEVLGVYNKFKDRFQKAAQQATPQWGSLKGDIQTCSAELMPLLTTTPLANGDEQVQWQQLQAALGGALRLTGFPSKQAKVQGRVEALDAALIFAAALIARHTDDAEFAGKLRAWEGELNAQKTSATASAPAERGFAAGAA